MRGCLALDPANVQPGGYYDECHRPWGHDGVHMADNGLTWEQRFDDVTDVEPAHDPVSHPAHYTGHPSGVECIQVTEHMNFCRGNAMKYLWRAGDKGSEIEDLRKARWYLDREIARLEAQNAPG